MKQQNVYCKERFQESRETSHPHLFVTHQEDDITELLRLIEPSPGSPKLGAIGQHIHSVILQAVLGKNSHKAMMLSTLRYTTHHNP